MPYWRRSFAFHDLNEKRYERLMSAARFSRAPQSSRNAVRPVKQKPQTQKFAPHTTETMSEKVFGGKLLLYNKGLDTCKNLPAQDVTEILIDNNPISTFQGFPPIRSLVKLSMDETDITNFKGFPNLPSLSTISLKGAPVSMHAQFRTAVLLLLPAVKVINGENVTVQEKKMAQLYPRECVQMVRQGWMPTFPPPRKSEIERITKGMTEGRVQTKKRETETATETVTAQNQPKGSVKQSELLQEELEQCESEIAKLEEEIKSLLTNN